MFEFIMTQNRSELARYSGSSTSIACKHTCNEILDGALLLLYTHAHFISKELTNERDSAAAILGANTSNTSSSRRENKRSGRQGDVAVTTLLLGQKVRQRVPYCKSLYFIMNILQSFWLHSINLFMQLMLAIVVHVTIQNILDNEFLVIIHGNFRTYIFSVVRLYFRLCSPTSLFFFFRLSPLLRSGSKCYFVFHHMSIPTHDE
jgi:hypothetical protein